MGELLNDVLEAINERRLFKPRERILVAVSGGVDSMVLLHLLHELAKQTGWRLTVAHLNHKLRGRESSADERLVRETAKRLGLPVVIERVDVRAFAKAQKLSIEMAARKLRHGYLARAAWRLKCRQVALGHHANDQLELFFLRLLRGAGSEGLSGMQWRNPSPSDARVELVRPLLGQTKARLEAYSERCKIRFREDSSNVSQDIQRNKIRYQLLPLLREEYQPALSETILRTIEIVSTEGELVRDMALQWLAGAYSFAETGEDTPSGRFDQLPLALQRRCLQLQLIALHIAPEFDLIENLRAKANRVIAVGGSSQNSFQKRTGARSVKSGETVQILVSRDAHGMISLHQPGQPDFNDYRQEVLLNRASGEVIFDGTKIEWRIGRKGGISGGQTRRNEENFDAERVGSPIVLRHWQPGDRFQPIGMTQTIKLQDVFTNEKVARASRHRLTVATTAKGELFWVEGLRISERFKLTERTNRRLQWRWQPP